MSELTKSQLIKYVVIILLIGVVIGSVSLVYPFGRDQGIYAYAGQQILEGKIQYKHVFDLKPPAVHFTFALGELTIGTSMLQIRFFDILWQSLTAIVIFLISFKITKLQTPSLIGAGLYLFLYFRFDYWQTLQADSFLNLPFAISIFLLLYKPLKGNLAKYFAAGFLFGITSLYKYTVIGFIPLLFVLIYLFYRNNKGAFKYVVLYTLGILFIFFLSIVVYSTAGALKEFIDINLVQLPNYANIGFQTETTAYIIQNILRLFFFSIYSPLILLFVIHLFVILKTRTFDFPNGLILIWFISVLINLIVQWKFFQYHFTVIFPPLVIGTALSYDTLKSKFGKYRFFIPVGITLLVLYCLTSYSIYTKNYSTLIKYLNTQQTLNEIYVEKGQTLDSAFLIQESFNAINYVERKTQKKDFIYIWGFDPLVYYISGRECSSRFIYNFPLYWKKENKNFRSELINELKNKTPKMILISKNDPLYYLSGFYEDSKQMLERFPEFEDFIYNNYKFTYETQNFDFYELKD